MFKEIVLLGIIDKQFRRTSQFSLCALVCSSGGITFDQIQHNASEVNLKCQLYVDFDIIINYTRVIS